mmetsp:Transcript_864/g.2261  ORF Transcript_864/g.2261 Transcript_864/m.2261 type:complete len:263 (+) Transcript_864:44-832(+)
MAGFLTWRDLAAQDVALLQGAGDPAEARRLLIGILRFTPVPSPKEIVLLEFFLNNLRFAAECKFTTEKTSAFFSILRTNHEETVRGHMTLDQSLRFFRELLLLHAVQRPPYSVGIFSFKDVSLITDFVNSTYYKHYKLFQYCFTQSHELVLKTRSNLAETAPLGFPPLGDAIKHAEPEPAPAAAPAEEAAAPAPAADVEPDELESLPPQLRAVITNKIQAEVRKMQAQMEVAFQERETRLLGKLATLKTPDALPVGKKTAAK